MTFFEYQIIMVKIETTNSYTTLRKIHTQLRDKPMDNFYIIHAINKVIKKFKEKTTSSIIRNKDYSEGTTSSHFNIAIQSAETKEQILLLLADFQGIQTIQLPAYSKSLIHMANLGITEFKDFKLSVNYYSVDYDYNKSLVETNRLPVSILCYLEEIKHTELYQNLLTSTSIRVKHWNGYGQQPTIDKINYQIDKQTRQIKALTKYKQLLEQHNDTQGSI